MQLLFDNGDEHVGGDGAPDLRLHRVLAGAQETLDAQVLLDPLERLGDILPINPIPPKSSSDTAFTHCAVNASR